MPDSPPAIFMMSGNAALMPDLPLLSGDQLEWLYVKYQVKDQDLFDKAFGYIRQYY